VGRLMTSKAYINALWEWGTRDEIIDKLKQIDEENDRHRSALQRIASGNMPAQEVVSLARATLGQVPTSGS
jgi:hypothetical protein